MADLSSCYKDRYRTVGGLRGAASVLCQALAGTEHHKAAAELHDSLCCFLPGPGSTTAEEVRFMMGEQHPGGGGSKV